DVQFGRETRFDPAVRVLEDPTLDLAADHGGLDDHLGVELPGHLDGRVQLLSARDLGDPDGGAPAGGLDEHGQPEAVPLVLRGRLRARTEDDLLTDRQSGRAENDLGELLVHPGGTREDPGADVRDAGEFEEPLDRPVLGVGAVHDREDRVNPGDHLTGTVAVGEPQGPPIVGGQPQLDPGAVRIDHRHSAVDDPQVRHVIGPEGPRPGRRDPHRDDVVDGAVEVRHDGAGGHTAHGVLGAAAAVEDGDGGAVHRAEATRAWSIDP